MESHHGHLTRRLTDLIIFLQLGKGMGATRVKANFSDIESQALRADQEKEQQIKNMAVQQEQDAEDEAKRM